MGNLNQFYFLGRVARAPQVEQLEERPVVYLSVSPGTGARAPRGFRLPPAPDSR